MTRPKVHTVEEAVQWLHDAFQRRYETHHDMRTKLKGKHRIIVLELTDSDPWTFEFEDGKLVRHGKGAHPKPDAKLRTTSRDLLAVFNKELPAMQAYLQGRIKVQARLSDVFFVKSLIS
ncbi:MAG TPA: SCP2 sterol-binding domain-containing protein [Candidatus Thermoplasmatota archaeon]|nr:SCP2 sterol-binding domain-containing protein [Candidatus Thermoplasmatota archaeon]